MSASRVEIEIDVPVRGPAIVRMPFRQDNFEWLHGAIGTRRPKWNHADKTWQIPKIAAQRVFDQATVEGRSARLTRRFRPDAEKCTPQCQSAKAETVYECTCICGGKGHGQRSGGWKSVGRDLLVRSSGGLIVQSIANRVD
jgi:hypothetical protein